MNVLIIEDEHFAAQRLQKLLLDSGHEFKILGVIDSIRNAVNWFHENPSPDLIFLDIHLADGLSFSIFEKVKIDVPVIFTTAYDEYAIRAFEIHSIDYLLKPIDPGKLKNALQKFDALKKFYQQPVWGEMFKQFKESLHLPKAFKSRILVNKGDSLVSIPVEEVAFFAAEDKVVMLYSFGEQKYLLNETLDHLEGLLDPARFFRVNRQCLLSLSAIVKVHHYFNYKLKIDTRPAFPEDLIVSKTRVQEFKEWLDR